MGSSGGRGTSGGSGVGGDSGSLGSGGMPLSPSSPSSPVLVKATGASTTGSGSAGFSAGVSAFLVAATGFAGEAAAFLTGEGTGPVNWLWASDCFILAMVSSCFFFLRAASSLSASFLAASWASAFSRSFLSFSWTPRDLASASFFFLSSSSFFLDSSAASTSRRSDAPSFRVRVGDGDRDRERVREAASRARSSSSLRASGAPYICCDPFPDGDRTSVSGAVGLLEPSNTFLRSANFWESSLIFEYPWSFYQGEKNLWKEKKNQSVKAKEPSPK